MFSKARVFSVLAGFVFLASAFENCEARADFTWISCGDTNSDAWFSVVYKLPNGPLKSDEVVRVTSGMDGFFLPSHPKVQCSGAATVSHLVSASVVNFNSIDSADQDCPKALIWVDDQGGEARAKFTFNDGKSLSLTCEVAQ